MSTPEQKAEYERAARERWEKVKRMGTTDRRNELELVSLTAAQEKQLAAHKKNLDLYFGGLQRSKAELLGYAFLIGNELNQAKDVLPHGRFEAFVEERYQLPKPTQHRWREHATCVVEKWEQITAGQSPTVGKSTTVVLLKSPLDLAGKKKFSKKEQAAILEIIPEIMERKGMVQFIQDCKLMREPKPAGGFRPDKEALEAWLKEHHPELAGQEYDALDPKVQKEFRKWYLTNQVKQSQSDLDEQANQDGEALAVQLQSWIAGKRMMRWKPALRTHLLDLGTQFNNKLRELNRQ